ncbi:MAG: hypothetical protein KF812_09785 [Fimbriimonadaceae bacterium]|nr:hypothetical protein [Fimbriimonadaceae bacterium]
MRSTFRSAGPVITTILAHIPCCGPVVLAALSGTSASAGWLQPLAPFRPWLLGLAIGQVVALFAWAAWAKRPTCCEQHAQDEGNRRFRLAWLTLAIVLSIQIAGVWIDMSHHRHADLGSALHLH